MDTDGIVHPAVRFGPSIAGVPEPVASAYDEARDCMSVAAYTACELVCRNILMYVAVEKGADEGLSFQAYVDHLSAEGYVTPPMKPWVDQIRTIGNAAAHRLEGRSQQRAESIVMFTAELLRLVFEMEAMTSKYATRPGPESAGA